MPKIADMREIDGELWCKVPTSEPSGVALWTPEEQEQNYQSGRNDALYDVCEFLHEIDENKIDVELISLLREFKNYTQGTSIDSEMWASERITLINWFRDKFLDELKRGNK